MRKALYLLLLALISCAKSNIEQKPDIAEEQLQAFIKDFSSSSGSRRRAPLDDLSAQSFQQNIDKTKAQIKQLHEIDSALLSGDDLIDWKFANSILAGRGLEQEKMQPWKRDPRIYLALTEISDVIDRPGDLISKISDIKKRLKLAPLQLNNGQHQLELFVPRFQELSLFMAENSFVLFDKDLPEFIKDAGQDADSLTLLTADARKSLDAFISFLKNDLPGKPKSDFAIGADVYNEMIKRQYLIPFSADSLYAFGLDQFNKTVRELEQVAYKINPKKTWQQLAVEIKNEYPEPAKMIEAHQQWVNKARDHIKEKNLIPIPWEERVNVVPRAEYLRKTSYYGNFSQAKGKDKDSVFTAEWMINPFEEQWDSKRKQEYLVEHDWGVIIVTAPHESYGGHHVQGLYQLHNPRPLRKNNGISFFSEGWGLYNEHLMQETGFLPNEKIHLRQLQLRLWRNARVIYDVGMHTGKMTYEEAISLMTDKVGFLRWAAQLEIDSSTASPGYFIGYFTGMMEILAMREEFKKKMGNKYSITDFHERLLKIGNMPPSLMREALMNSI
jgi:uncharacterized protein (DUF885 family)